MQSFYIAVNATGFDNECWKVIVIRNLLQESMEMGRTIGKFGSYLVCTANPLIQVVFFTISCIRAIKQACPLIGSGNLPAELSPIIGTTNESVQNEQF